MPDACRYFFSLNRYVKHSSCTRSNRDYIYLLKNDLVKLLYERGYSTGCYFHDVELPAQACYACEGSGTFDDGTDEGPTTLNPTIRQYFTCDRCNGTGMFKPAKTITFVCFEFMVGGTKYCWHQPKETVRYDYTITKDTSTITLSKEEKPISLSVAELEEGKRLIGWLLARYGESTIKRAA